MSVQVAPEIQARWEVWRSFESCIRSYAAVEGLSDAETPKVFSFGDHIDVTWHGVYLGFTMHPGDGKAVWSIRWANESTMWGSFQMLSEGAFLVGENKQDIDHAAIDFLSLQKSQIAMGRGSSSLTARQAGADQEAVNP